MSFFWILIFFRLMFFKKSSELFRTFIKLWSQTTFLVQGICNFQARHVKRHQHKQNKPCGWKSTHAFKIAFARMNDTLNTYSYGNRCFNRSSVEMLNWEKLSRCLLIILRIDLVELTSRPPWFIMRVTRLLALSMKSWKFRVDLAMRRNSPTNAE